MTDSPRLRPWMLVSALWLAPAILAVVQGVGYSQLYGEPLPSARSLIWRAGDWVLYAAFTPVIFWTSHKWPLVRSHLARHVAIHVAFALLLCVVWAVSGKLLELLLALLMQPDAVRRAMTEAGSGLAGKVAVQVTEWILTTLPFGVVVYTTVAGFAHAITYFLRARDRDVQVARLAEQLSSARYSALQARLNPHFLFNTLNTIAVFIREGDRTGAVRIVEHLSEVLRETLNKHRGSEVTLKDEIDLVRQYLAIETARFPDRLSVNMTVNANCDLAAVPSFSVQHLVENAIRHGIAKVESAGQVTLTAHREGELLVVRVTDDGPGIQEQATGDGRGLDNTRQRMLALYGESASLTVSPREEGGTVALLRIPYRELPAADVNAES